VLEGRAIRPQDAKNAKEVAPYIGTQASKTSPPPGYVVTGEAPPFTIRRAIAEDGLFAPLTTDAQGRIQWGSSERISKPGALAQALGPGLRATRHTTW
jgi:hypothetical protein